MNENEFNEIISKLDANEQMIFALLIGAIPNQHPTIITEAWRHTIITGMYKKINDEFEEAAKEHVRQGILVSHN